MKNKILLLLSLTIVGGCNETHKQRNIQSASFGYKIEDVDAKYNSIWTQDYDQCEYIVYNSYTANSPSISHKGNCKYCLKRNTK